MALYTKKLIMSTFQEMQEELPFNKITVAALVKRAGISPNTFYYHYQDIYALLGAWFWERAESFIPSNAPIEWKSTTKAVLHQCKAHPKTVYHVFNGLSRDHLERYIFSLTDDVFLKVVQQVAEGRPISDNHLRNIASFCRYAYIGFVMQFFWNHMENDIDETIVSVAGNSVTVNAPAEAASCVAALYSADGQQTERAVIEEGEEYVESNSSPA